MTSALDLVAVLGGEYLTLVTLGLFRQLSQIDIVLDCHDNEFIYRSLYNVSKLLDIAIKMYEGRQGKQ